MARNSLRGIVLAFLGLALIAIVPARALAVSTLRSQEHILSYVTCPESTFCAAFGGKSVAVETANPLADSSWSAVNVVGERTGILGLSCPSAGFCVAVDESGDIATSSNPGAQSPEWQVVHVDGNLDTRAAGGFDDGTENGDWEGVSCPSPSLCVAVDDRGNLLASTAPAGGASAWHIFNVDGRTQLDAISCAPATTFCAAVDSEGRLLVSGQAGAGADAWSSRALDTGMRFQGLSCPSAGFCIAIDYEWNVFTSTEPANPASWHLTGSIPTPAFYATVASASARSRGVAHASGASASVGSPGENIMSCVSPSYCAIPSYHTDEIWTNTDPGDPGSAWTGVAQGLPTEREDTVVAVGCASSSLCVGGAWFGEGLISQGPFADPSPWRVRLAPAVLPSTTSTPRLSHVYLRGHVRRRYGFVTTAGMHAKLGFTFAAAPHMLPLAGVEFFNWTRYKKVHGGYAPNSNGFFVTGAHRRLRKHVRVTVRGHPVAFSLKPEGDSGMAIYLKRPAPRFRVVVSRSGARVRPSGDPRGRTPSGGQGAHDDPRVGSDRRRIRTRISPAFQGKGPRAGKAGAHPPPPPSGPQRLAAARAQTRTVA